MNGFQLLNGKILSSQCVGELVEESKRDLKVTHRLSEKHINVQRAQRMRVKFAVQLLSETTGKCVKYFGERNMLRCKDWGETSEFIALVDSWFDLFNARVLFDKDRQSRNAYGTNMGKQNEVLDIMVSSMKKMRICSSNRKFQFQRGITVSSQSLPKLYEVLKKKYDISFILTYRLNQEGLEHFFGYMRKMGTCYEYPSPVSEKHRLRL